ncbi:GNAT family N-acetyltransferase [Bacillus thermotolerans]|uniref:Ribosomal-protein-alanine acetyltransferase n=1 Tax=Bacillus thermotolerans TaxID=1221996 RepID=A0A0F5HYV0_BACTR|nr:GNAT family N-acetyltransferase [Bacillus thermotolerans]KKB38182.1 Ribosomal-protein-alanine acetyltransferase [Bacillus thermotolerans]KKB38549.1 Ribosomal-protein-alanine acetyltransferase [Bacillus thermotolerans]
MLKKRDVHDSQVLFDLMTHPDVFPFVRHKVHSYEEFLFITKQMIDSEENGELISRTITDEWGAPIGTITLYDVNDNAGFLGTWLGKPYHGKGYNMPAKEAFFHELFFELGIESVFMKIRKANVRSRKAAEKLPYAVQANDTRPAIYLQINEHEDAFDLYEIPKDLFTLYALRQQNQEADEQALEA